MRSVHVGHAPILEMRVGRTMRRGCVDVSSYWNHWPCLFPQHGVGRKHERRIELLPWQSKIVGAHPADLLRGLIQPDGCRVMNRVNGREYPRYMFTNRSEDIHLIFQNACDAYGVSFTRMNATTRSVARRSDVTKLDRVIGPKS